MKKCLQQLLKWTSPAAVRAHILTHRAEWVEATIVHDFHRVPMLERHAWLLHAEDRIYGGTLCARMGREAAVVSVLRQLTIFCGSRQTKWKSGSQFLWISGPEISSPTTCGKSQSLLVLLGIRQQVAR